MHPDPGPVRPVSGQPCTPPALGSYHPEGTACTSYSTPTFECFPYVVSLAPSGTTTLSVTGVEPDGALDLAVTTSAVTTVNEVPPPPSPSTFTCQAAPTAVTLWTQPTPSAGHGTRTAGRPQHATTGPSRPPRSP